MRDRNRLFQDRCHPNSGCWRRRRREWEEEVRSSVHLRVLHYVPTGRACACSGYRCWLEETAPPSLGYTAEPADTTAAPLGVVSPCIIHSTAEPQHHLNGVTMYHTQHIITQLSTNNFISILYFNIILNFYPKLDILYLQTVSAFCVIFLQRTPS